MKPRPEIIARLHELRFTRYLNSSMLPSIPKGFCKWCGGKAARVWCGVQCRQEAYVRMGYVTNYLLVRDRGRCKKCGLDTKWLTQQINNIQWIWRRDRNMPHIEFHRQLGWTDRYNRLWEADHIIPVSEGGGCCGLENFQTLCLPCHKNESAILAKRRASDKRDGTKNGGDCLND